VHPLSNLIATEQVRGGDFLRVDYEEELGRMSFFKDAEGMAPNAMAQMIESPVITSVGTPASAAGAEVPRSAKVRSSRR
jgi:ATP-dependent Clp protease ATP-binding subunit ClpB